MVVDDELASRIRAALSGESGVTEMRMFGGLAFLLGGHMAVAAGADGLLVRVPHERSDELAEQPHVSSRVMPGRTMRGWLRVDPAGVRSDADLAGWVALGVGVAHSLPPKQP